MSARNCGPPQPMKGVPPGLLPLHANEPPRGRAYPPMPHPALFDGMREHPLRMDPRAQSAHPAIMQERLAAQHEEINILLVDNQRLAATHVALKQELEHVQHELQRVARISSSIHPEKDIQMREMYERSIKLEAELRGVDAMRNELMHLQAEIKELSAARQELNGQVHVLNQDLARATADVQQAPGLKAEIEGLKHELQRARAAIEYEKKGYAENYEHGQAMEKNLVSMARELEKLRAEIASSEIRTRSTSAVGNPGYMGSYGNAEAGYRANPYSINPAHTGVESFSQYGSGPGSWGSYDMHQAQRHV